MKLKNKAAIISIVILCISVCSISFYVIPPDNKESNMTVNPSNVNPQQGILNGDFETGDLTDWITGGDHPALVQTGPYLAHSGTYGCKISGYSGGYYHHSWIEQDLTHSIIFSDFVDSFSFWRMTDKLVRVTVTYWDNTTTIHEFSGAFTWTQHFITGLTPGKRLKTLRFETLQDGANIGGIDDLSLTYIPILTEGISNGDFETGDLTDWITGGDYPAMVQTGPYLAHSGTYGCKISGYTGGYYHHSWIEQDLTLKYIYSDLIDSFSFWRMTDKLVRVTVTYWDDTTTIHDFSGAFTWTQHFITGLTLGKRLKTLRFETLQDGANIGGIDDLTLIYSKVLPLQEEGIFNGDFETGDLTDWITGGDHPALVQTGPYLAHSGTYGCKVSGYSGGYYHHSWIEQDLTRSVIYSDLIDSFSFWRMTDKLVRVTVTYWDDTTTIHDFSGAFTWTQHFITGLTPGKRLKTLRFETLQDGVNIGGIDDLTLTYNYTSLLPETPILSSILPNPDRDGNITIAWNDVFPIEYYTVFRYSSVITELNGSVITLGTTTSSTFTDLGLKTGIYYYAVNAENDIGSSDISNCESVVVDLPGPEAPILAEILPNPDTDGDITLDWNDILNADNYTIYRYSSPITELNGSITMLGTIVGSTYNDLDLDEDTYYYVVTATNETGTSEISNCESVVVDLPEPEAPILAEILPNPDTDGNITLDWNDVPSAILYYIYRSNSHIWDYNENLTLLGTTTETFYEDLIVENGVYYYVIIAENANGVSNISNCESIQVKIEEQVDNGNGDNMILILTITLVSVGIASIVTVSTIGIIRSRSKR